MTWQESGDGYMTFMMGLMEWTLDIEETVAEGSQCMVLSWIHALV